MSNVFSQEKVNHNSPVQHLLVYHIQWRYTGENRQSFVSNHLRWSISRSLKPLSSPTRPPDKNGLPKMKTLWPLFQMKRKKRIRREKATAASCSHYWEGWRSSILLMFDPENMFVCKLIWSCDKKWANFFAVWSHLWAVYFRSELSLPKKSERIGWS